MPDDLRVRELLPGDTYTTELPGEPRACFIAQTDHPVFPGLRLVIWRMTGGRWSHDALHAEQSIYMGTLVERGGRDRARDALFGMDEWGDAT